MECSTKLEKLDESLFNLLCEVLFIPDLPKKEQINYITLFYSKSEIQEKLDLCKEQYATIIKLNELDETLFDILCGTISILELSKEDKIEYLRNNYSKSEIDNLSLGLIVRLIRSRSLLTKTVFEYSRLLFRREERNLYLLS